MRADVLRVPPVALSISPASAVRHAAYVRITHWMHTAGFIGLVVSGTAILLAHPRLYWGETGAWDVPPLINLPLPLVLGHSGWGRYLHFLSAWVCVLAGLVYVIAGVASRHLQRELIPRRSDVALARLGQVAAEHLRRRFVVDDAREYNVIQRLAYVSVVLVLFPLAIASGLAMSPAIASVAPLLVNTFGGQQSARTIHFFAAAALVLFLIVHVTMVVRAGFVRRMRAMIVGTVD